MSLVSKIPLTVSIVVLSFTIIIGACSNSPYQADELEYIKNVKPKTEKPLIIAFGDSLTGGFTLDKKLAFPNLLEARLNEAGCAYEVLNFGVNGDTTEKALTRLDYALNFAKTEIFILELGANDAMMKTEDVGKIKANLQKIISRIKRRNIKILLCGFGPDSSLNENYRDRLRRMYHDLAAENDVSLMTSFMKDLDAKFLMSDNIHPNEAGVKIIERNVFEALKPLLSCGG